MTMQYMQQKIKPYNYALRWYSTEPGVCKACNKQYRRGTKLKLIKDLGKCHVMCPGSDCQVRYEDPEKLRREAQSRRSSITKIKRMEM